MKPAPCPGCSETRHLRPYVARFGSPDAEPEPVRYCDECAELAESNWNGETFDVRPVLDERDALERFMVRDLVRRGIIKRKALEVARNSMRY